MAAPARAAAPIRAIESYKSKRSRRRVELLFVSAMALASIYVVSTKRLENAALFSPRRTIE